MKVRGVPWPVMLGLGVAGGIVGSIGAGFIVSVALWRRYVG